MLRYVLTRLILLVPVLLGISLIVFLIMVFIPGDPAIAILQGFATAENEWRELFWRYIPRWLTVDDFTVLKSYYNGDSTFYLKNHIYAWLRPVAWWSAFLIVMSFVMLCLASIFRQQWTEREKLS